MLTALGKELRKLRIDNGINMMQMAASMDLSAAMLNTVETGHKKAPGDFVGRLMQAFPLLRKNIKRYVALVNLNNREVGSSLKEAENDAVLVTAAIQRFADLTDCEKKGFRNLFKRP